MPKHQPKYGSRPGINSQQKQQKKAKNLPVKNLVSTQTLQSSPVVSQVTEGRAERVSPSGKSLRSNKKAFL